MKYESELLHELLESRGHQKSSLHYQSECVEAFIEEAKGAYPKLCDYESEWLNYIVETPIGDFPYVSFSGTEGIVENVVPYAYKSAILKGQTLVNVLNYSFRNNYSSVLVFNIRSLNNIKPLTSYLMYIIDETNKVVGFNISNNKSNTIIGRTDGTKTKVTTNDFILNNQSLYIYPKNGIVFEDSDVNKIKIMLIEYQDGMENWYIPYFEGMQSVKMPVLTTTSYEPYKTNILSTSEDVILRGIGDVRDTLDCLTGEVTERIKEILNVEKGAWFLAGQTPSGLRTRFYIQVSDFKALSEVKSDKFNYIGKINGVTDVEGVGCHVVAKEIHLIVDNDKLSSLDLEGLDEFFKNNNTLIQYQLETPVVKTVDLTITNQDGETLNKLKPIEGTMHITTDGNPIKPTFEAEIPVEAITQNLNSFTKE